jgi:hypothetical protein
VLIKEELIAIVSVFLFVLLLSMNTVLAHASTSTPPPSATTTGGEEQPKPGTIMIITFENGTTKAIRTDSTNLQAVTGGYFIADPSVKASQPLQSKTVSNTVVQQLVNVFVDVSIDEPPQLTSSKGCGEGFGYNVDDPNPICEPIDKIRQGPPLDMAFCAALGCPYNPPAETELPGENNNNNVATIPVTPTESPAVEPQPSSDPELYPGDGDQNGGENQNEDGDDGDDDGEGSTEEGEGDTSGGDESESEE